MEAVQRPNSAFGPEEVAEASTSGYNLDPQCFEPLERLQARLRAAAAPFRPAICSRRPVDVQYLQHTGVAVTDWRDKAGLSMWKDADALVLAQGRKYVGSSDEPQRRAGRPLGPTLKSLRQNKASKVAKPEGHGRKYTSKYRGVHQTLPTRRWEAQFRRNGKPTSLGCFDREEEAAKAYDKMMLWCELHNVGGVKSGITNFEMAVYDKDTSWLQRVTQDELIESLRGEGRRQAAHRMMRHKRDAGGGTDYETEGTAEPE